MCIRDRRDIFKTNLNLEDFEDEEEYIEVFFEEEMSDIRYNSVYYYTDLIVKDGKKILEEISSKKNNYEDKKIESLINLVLKIL